MALIHNASPSLSDLRDQDVAVGLWFCIIRSIYNRSAHKLTSLILSLSSFVRILTTQYPSCLFAVDYKPVFFFPHWLLWLDIGPHNGIGWSSLTYFSSCFKIWCIAYWLGCHLYVYEGDLVPCTASHSDINCLFCLFLVFRWTYFNFVSSTKVQMDIVHDLSVISS